MGGLAITPSAAFGLGLAIVVAGRRLFCGLPNPGSRPGELPHVWGSGIGPRIGSYDLADRPDGSARANHRLGRPSRSLDDWNEGKLLLDDLLITVCQTLGVGHRLRTRRRRVRRHVRTKSCNFVQLDPEPFH